jgi:hypothetical protein
VAKKASRRSASQQWPRPLRASIPYVDKDGSTRQEILQKLLRHGNSSVINS